MYGEQGVKAVYKKVHLVKFRAKGSSIFFEYEGTSCYATTVYKILCGTYLAANITNLYTISGLCKCWCAEIIQQAWKKHKQTRFSL